MPYSKDHGSETLPRITVTQRLPPACMEKAALDRDPETVNELFLIYDLIISVGGGGAQAASINFHLPRALKSHLQEKSMLSGG